MAEPDVNGTVTTSDFDRILLEGPDFNRAFVMALGQDGFMTSASTDDVQGEGPADETGSDDGTTQVVVLSSDAEDSVASQVEQPAKVMRIGTMIKQLLEEVRAAPLDEAGRQRLAEIHRSSIKELEEGLSDDLKEELDRLTIPFDPATVPSEAELRIAQAQLVGWLEGLFHGIQTALFAQQMAARAQLEQMRNRALPGHVLAGGASGMQGAPGMQDGSTEHGTGQYL